MQLSNLQLPGIVTTCRFITASQLQTLAMARATCAVCIVGSTQIQHRSIPIQLQGATVERLSEDLFLLSCSFCLHMVSPPLK